MITLNKNNLEITEGTFQSDSRTMLSSPSVTPEMDDKMKTIEKFDKTNLKQMREVINNALLLVSDNYNVELKIGRINFEPKGFSTKLEVNLVIDGQVQTKEARDFESLANLYGCKFPLGFEFNQGSNPTPKHFKVIGLKTRSRKYPIQCKDVNSDDIYGFKIDWVNVEYEKINAIHETIKTDDFDSGEG